MQIFQQKSSKSILDRLLIFFVAFILLFYYMQDAYSATGSSKGIGRTRSCLSNGSVGGGNLDFNMTNGGDDVEFSLSNPVCLTVILTTYVTVKIAIANMNSVCGVGSSVPRVLPSPLLDSFDLARATVKAATDALYSNYACGSQLAIGTTYFAGAMVQLGVIHNIAQKIYNNTELCGADWVKPNPETFDLSKDGKYKTEITDKIQDLYDIYDATNVEPDGLNLENKSYREWFYGGKEVSDNSDQVDDCLDPARVGDKPKQRYYMRGSTANFNCKRYLLGENNSDPRDPTIDLTTQRREEFEKAYKCCKERSSNYVCIDYGDGASVSSKKVFCKAGKLCSIAGITFSPNVVDNGRLICVESYSLCPYNFTLGGGSEYCEYYKDGIWNSSTGRWEMITAADIASGICSSKSIIRNDDCTYNDKANKCKNYCQYLTHCFITSDVSYKYESNLSESPYFSSACIDFVGDSQNKTRYNGGAVFGSQRHFSAPIAQCMKESIENLFYNRFGHSECKTVNEYPSSDGTCASGQYDDYRGTDFRKGDQVNDTSFFATIQNSLQDVVKMVLILSVTFYGMNILLGKADIRSKKDILVYLLKIGLVLYFSTGDAWQTYFFKGVYGASSDLSRMVFKINDGEDKRRRDGCQFGDITNADGSTTSSGVSYPVGKEYLALWDSLDCKIMRYLGFGPEVSTANIASLILASSFSMVGIYFAIAVMFFGFFFIAATIRALHIFISSALSIIIMVFISPLIIPTVLFDRTKDIFSNWLKELISFCLQPMILFAYIAVFITIMDKTMIGSASFAGNSPAKTINCNSFCMNDDESRNKTFDSGCDFCLLTDGSKVKTNNEGECTEGELKEDGKKVDPMNDSVACLIGINDYGKFPGFELIGISIPILKNVFTGNVKGKILTILKGALVMFLLYTFMDQITSITSALIGGTALPGSTANALTMFNRTAGLIRGIQRRSKQGLKNAAMAAYNEISSGGSSGKTDEAGEGAMEDSSSSSTEEVDSGEEGEEGADEGEEGEEGADEGEQGADEGRYQKSKVTSTSNMQYPNSKNSD